MLDAASISLVLDLYRPERARLLETLSELTTDQWALPTECPSYDVKGIATHILGDDLSLLSRQRDEGENGLLLLAPELPDADFRTLLDTFNDRWVAAAAFFSPAVLLELLGLAGDWTADYYQGVEPESEGEYVGFFGGPGPTSPFWQAIAREYLERWVHHSQIKRALGNGPLDDRHFVIAGVQIVAAIARVEAPVPPEGGDWSFGEVVLGDTEQAANVLTRGLTADEVRDVVTGPAPAVAALAQIAGRT